MGILGSKGKLKEATDTEAWAGSIVLDPGKGIYTADEVVAILTSLGINVLNEEKA